MPVNPLNSKNRKIHSIFSIYIVYIIVFFRKNEKFPVKMIYSSELQYQPVKGKNTDGQAQVSDAPDGTVKWGFGFTLIMLLKILGFTKNILYANINILNIYA